MKYGYIRVSTKEQDETRQIDAMKKEGVLKSDLFIEKASGKNFIGREQWEKLLAKVVIGDIIVIKELDRLGRNINEIKEQWELLIKKGVDIEIIEQPVLNTVGRSEIEKQLIQPIIFQLLSYIAEKERVKLLSRQKEAYESLEKDDKGRKISRKKNKVVGRPNKQETLSQEQKRYIQSWISKSIKLSDCIKVTGLSEATLYRIKKGMKEV